MLYSILALTLSTLHPHEPLVLDDFDRPERAENTPRWLVVNDNVMGGRSTGGPSFHDGVLTFAGFVNTNGGGFSSIRAGARDLDLSDYDAIRVRVRGDDRTYSVSITTKDRFRREYVTYQADFRAKSETEWAEIDVPFEAFNASWRGWDISSRVPPMDVSDIRRLGLSISDGIHGPFELHVDSLSAVTAEPSEISPVPTASLSDGDAKSDPTRDARLDSLLEKLGVFDRANPDNEDHADPS